MAQIDQDEDHPRGGVEGDPPPHQRELQDDQPEPPREEEPGELRFRLPPRRRQEGPGPREEDEDRRAEVGRPARQEQGGVRAGQVGRVEPEVGEKAAHVVQDHQHHHESTQHVDRVQT